jgi:hypothetical protein
LLLPVFLAQVTHANLCTDTRLTLLQLLVAGAAFILAAGIGMPIGYSAVLLPQLQHVNSTLPTDDEIGSWIGKYFYHLA